MNGQLHVAAAVPAGKQSPVSLEHGAGGGTHTRLTILERKDKSEISE
jgi:hypothetical protein